MAGNGMDAVKTKDDLCTGRKRYKTREAAARTAAEHENGREYRCPHCPGFHVALRGIGGKQ